MMQDSDLLSGLPVETMLSLYQIGTDDIEALRRFGALMKPRLDDYVTAFYRWLQTQPEFELFFADPYKLTQVQKLQRDDWDDFFDAHIDERY